MNTKMIYHIKKPAAILIAALGLLSFAPLAGAMPFTLTNGPGDGTVSVGVDGFGSFGSSIGINASNALYDPVGAGGVAGTTFESGVAIGFGMGYSFLTSGLIGSSGGLSNPMVSGTATSASSNFTFSGLSFSLSQVLTNLLSGSVQTGSLLTQTYTINNTGNGVASFDLIRYLDGDLLFDGNLSGDGGGRIVLGGVETLFETDTAAGSATSTTFVGITGTGGTTPGSNRYEIDSFSGLRSRIIAGTALDDIITGDGEDPLQLPLDQFIDAGFGYDVTLALRNTFSLGIGGSTTYTTTTLFGSGVPGGCTNPNGCRTVPEPSIVALMSLGLLGLGFARRFSRNS